MRRAAVSAALAVCVVLVTACDEQSRVDPEATVVIAGLVQAADGSPLSGRPVRLGGGIGSDGLLAALTLGLSCTGGGCSGDVFETTTDAGGHFSFTLKGRNTQSSFGEAVTELVSVSAAPGPGQVSGASVSARFKVQVENVSLPQLVLVDPDLSVQAGADVVAGWDTTRPGPYELTFEMPRTFPVWRVTTGTGPVAVDPRVLEDTSGRVVVAAEILDRIEGSDVTIGWRSPGVPYAAGAGPPPSRGRPCQYVDAAGLADPRAAGECGLTDGDLARPATAGSICTGPPRTGTGPPPPGGGCTPAAFAVIDLGGALPAELVVVRGCSGGCPVDVSADGTTYVPAGSVSDEYGLVALAGRPVRTVRVGVGSFNVTGLREVSVWGPRPPSPPLRALGGTDRARVGRQFLQGGDDDVPLALVAVGMTALLAALGGAVVVSLRRP